MDKQCPLKFGITASDLTLLQWDNWAIVGSLPDSNPGVPMYGLMWAGTAATAIYSTQLQSCYSQPHYIKYGLKKHNYCIVLALKPFELGGQLKRKQRFFIKRCNKKVVSSLYTRFMCVGICRYIPIPDFE